MAHLPREPEAFGEQVARLLRRYFPDREAELAGPMDLVVAGRHLDLENLYRMVLRNPERGTEIVEDYLEKIIEGDAALNMPLPLAVAKPRIMPRIQPLSVFERLDREQVAHVPFVNGTVIVFVIDMPEVTVSITTEQMIRWSVTAEELEMISRSNLARYTPDLTVRVIDSKDGGRVAMLSQQDGYDAARLLLETLHPKLAPELDGDFLVATPARDSFLAMTIGPDGFNDRLKERISREFRRLPYPITRNLFLVTRDGIAGTTSEAA
ncbi:MAG: DUF1444 family protein [Phycisphaerales bacterium]|nr:DUF1444 family protein [Phycisphaerales bacterium]